jgi:hypothetical protein
METKFKYNNHLEEWNNNRNINKCSKIDEICSIIFIEWEADFCDLKNKDIWKTNYEKVVLIFVKNWLVSWKDDLSKKILYLSEELWYSLDQIWSALTKVSFELEKNRIIELHKQTILRIINKEKINELEAA